MRKPVLRDSGRSRTVARVLGAIALIVCVLPVSAIAAERMMLGELFSARW